MYFPVAAPQKKAADASDQGVLESRKEIHGTEINSLFGRRGTALTTDVCLKCFNTLSRDRNFLPFYFWHFCESLYFTCCSYFPTVDLFSSHSPPYWTSVSPSLLPLKDVLPLGKLLDIKAVRVTYGGLISGSIRSAQTRSIFFRYQAGSLFCMELAKKCSLPLLFILCAH